jgi:hypothetical protein
MRSLIDSVLRPIAAFVLAAVVANCNDGCIPGWQQMSPADAYKAEIGACVAQRNADVLSCASDAGTVPDYLICREDADEADRICRGAVDRKYANYNNNGNYPSEQPPPPVR